MGWYESMAPICAQPMYDLIQKGVIVLRNILIETVPTKMHTPTPLPPLDAATLRQKAAQRRREAAAFARHIPHVERESDAYKIRWHRTRIAELLGEAEEFDRRAAAVEGDTQR